MSQNSNLIIDLKHIQNAEIAIPDDRIKNLMILSELHVLTPGGFVIMPDAYKNFFYDNSLDKKISDLLTTVHYERSDSIMQVSNHIKKLIKETPLNDHLISALNNEYKKFNKLLRKSKLIVGYKYNVENFAELLVAIKKIWAENFSPNKLIENKNHKIWISKGSPILIQKLISSNKNGKMYTNQTEINSHILTPDEKKQIESIKIKLKKYFYIPYEVNWSIDKKKTFVVDLKPMTNLHLASLVLIRHGRSDYNEKGLWAGWDDPDLTKNGKEDVRVAAENLRDIHFDLAYTSHLKRHKQTIDVLKEILNRHDLPITINDALLERNYGDLTRKNKWDIKEQYGNEQFIKWRRGWDTPIPNGESLKDVYERVVPFYEEFLLPKLKSGKNIVVASSGNCLRAFVKYLDNISDDDISTLEIATGEAYVYQINEDGKIVSKEIRNKHENKL